MKNAIYATIGILSGILMVLGLLYIIQKKQDEKIGGRLVKVDYRFSKEFH